MHKRTARSWHRLTHDYLLQPPPRNLLLAITGTLLASSATAILSANRNERLKNTLLTNFAEERINQIAKNLEADALDWAIWDETDQHLKGSNPNYYKKAYNQYSFARTPFVVALNRKGQVFSSTTWDPAKHQPASLTSTQEQEIHAQIPAGDALKPATFLAEYQGKPFLFTAQPVSSTSSLSPPSGRLVFARRLDSDDISFKDSNTLNKALGVTNESYGKPGGSLRNLLSEIEVVIPLRRWQGITPMQLAIKRYPEERLLASHTIGLLLISGGLLIAATNIRSGMQKRQLRLLETRNKRRNNQVSRQLEYRRHHDELTGLLSHQGLATAIQKQSQYFPNFKRALVHVDLDHFSVTINGLGRTHSDDALIAFASELKKRVHPSTALARVGAHEFACSIIGTSETSLRSEVTELNTRLNDMNLHVDNQILNITTSIGAAFIDDANPEQSLHEASIACSVVKVGGGRGYQFYGDAQGTTSNYLAYQQANQELITAIHDKRLELYAQHAWLLDKEQAYPSTYVELLCRIRDPKQDRIYWHENLIHAAHLCGSLPLLDQHVLQLAFSDLTTVFSKLHQSAPLPHPTFAINITPETLLSPDFSKKLELLLDASNFNPGQICLEITEQAALKDPGLAIASMRRLRKLGICFALDDFGTGTTSLGYLRDLPLDYVKIDKSFINKLRQDKASNLIVQFVVELGKEIGFQTIAEGVENIPLLLELQALGVSIAQGYVVTKPQPLLNNAKGMFFLESGSDAVLLACEPSANL